MGNTILQSIEDSPPQASGNALAYSVQLLGAHDAWYKHCGSIRVQGNKTATFVIAELESAASFNGLISPGGRLSRDLWETRDFLRVVWGPPEVRDKAVEFMMSVE
jgi:long-chain acyl-CoA synthetase